MPAILLSSRPVEEPVCPTCGNAPEPLAWIVHHAKGNPPDVVLWCKFHHGWKTQSVTAKAAEPGPGQTKITWHPDTCGCIFVFLAPDTVFSEAQRLCPAHDQLEPPAAFDQVLAENRSVNIAEEALRGALPRHVQLVEGALAWKEGVSVERRMRPAVRGKAQYVSFVLVGGPAVTDQERIAARDKLAEFFGAELV